MTFAAHIPPSDSLEKIAILLQVEVAAAIQSSLRMLTLVFTGAALAFSPSASQRVRPGLSRHAALTVAPATCSHCRVAAEPTMALGGAVKWVLAAPVMYALMSINEYATHRWYQHEEFNRDHAFQRFCQDVAAFFAKRPKLLKDGRRNMIKLKGGGHVEHHAETYDDMSLKKDERWRRTPAAASLDEDKFRGTAFSWEVPNPPPSQTHTRARALAHTHTRTSPHPHPHLHPHLHHHLHHHLRQLQHPNHRHRPHTRPTSTQPRNR